MSLTPGDKFNSLLWMDREMNIPMNSLTVFLQVLNIYTGWVKKVWFAAPGAKLYLFCATLLNGVFNFFFENLHFFLVLQWLKQNLEAKLSFPSLANIRIKIHFPRRKHKMKESQLTLRLKVVPLDIKIKFWRLARCHT